MKYSHVLVAMLILVCAVSSCKTGREKVDFLNDENLERRVYEVFGMNCPGCEPGLEKLVRKIDAVMDASASWKDRQLVVAVKQGMELDDEDVFDAIQRANFTPGKRIK
jgi:copper chaperone CopZ